MRAVFTFLAPVLCAALAGGCAKSSELSSDASFEEPLDASDADTPSDAADAPDASDAAEVPDFYTYYNSNVAGGTKVASAYRLVNRIVETENLEQDYNIYIFHGTDGDDWDTDGKESLPELKKMLRYANRVGVTIAERSMGSNYTSEVEKYLKSSGLLKDAAELLRLDVLKEDANEARLIEGIKNLISE